jgi:hypothetical protein
MDVVLSSWQRRKPRLRGFLGSTSSTSPAAGASFRPPVVVPLNQAVGSIANDTGGCQTFTLSNPPLVTANAYMFLCVEVTDTQSVATTSGALAQLGRVTATYTP